MQSKILTYKFLLGEEGFDAHLHDPRHSCTEEGRPSHLMGISHLLGKFLQLVVHVLLNMIFFVR